MRNVKGLLAAALGLMLFSTGAYAQDFPTLKGTNARSGHGDVPSSGPGDTLLKWFKPTRNEFGGAIIVDNKAGTATGAWVSPAIEDEASGVYVPPTDITPPHYQFATTIPSGQGSDPTQKLNLGDPDAKFSWSLDAGDGVARNYALYTWLPIGPTLDGGTGDPIFPQRYFVYKITYGDGTKTLVDVVDSFQGGFGWVRLGNGGRATSMMFDTTGAVPITIELYNTVPRNEGHEFDIVPSPIPPAYDWTVTFTDVPYTTVVYADAMMAVPEIGRYVASPVVKEINSGTNETRVVRALNLTTSGIANGDTVSYSKGTVYSDKHDDGATQWTWSPLDESGSAVTLDNDSAGVVPTLPWTNDTTVPGYRGADYHSAAITGTLGSEATMAYSPTMPDGSYEIMAWLSGNGGNVFGNAVRYEIKEGATTTYVTVDQDNNKGWVRVGSRRYTHADGLGEPLSVNVTNYSALPGDLGKTAYADSIRFVGGTNLDIESTPVMARALVRTVPAGVPAETEVTIVADEQGRIYCLDSTGNGDGSTTVYWTYPHPTITDPLDVGAEMPTGFGKSSGLVQRIDGVDYLFIGSENGRVYCLDMTGNGDGTTSRVWSYPDDIPATAVTTSLGAIEGSVAYSEIAGEHYIYVPTEQGRMYALDAKASANRTTRVRWAYPGLAGSTFGTFTSAARNAGDTAWGGAADAETSDGVYASTSPDLAGAGTGESEYLDATSPNAIAIPATAAVNGIEFRLVRRANGGEPTEFIRDANVRVIKGGVRQGATDRADFVTAWPSTDGAKVYGSPTDKWGQSWLPTDFGAGFGFSIAVSSNADSTNTPSSAIPAAEIDSIEVRVYYSESSLGAIVSTPSVAFGRVYFGTVSTGESALPAWSSTTTYALSAVVAAATGRSYRSVQNGNTGNDPVTDTGTWWEDVGVASPPGWNSSTTYDAGALVAGTNARTYRSVQAGNTGNDPTTDDGTWWVLTGGGNFIAVDAATGSRIWQFNGTTQWSSTLTDFVVADDFSSGSATAIAADTGYTDDLVFVANDNRWISALKADDGSLLWTTDELGTTVSGNLTFTQMNVYNDSGVKAAAPIVLVPTSDGRFDGLFALPGTGFGAENVEGRKRAFEYVAEGDSILASMAVGRGFLYGADSAGYFYAFSNSGGVFDPDDIPGQETVVENRQQSAGQDRFKDTAVKFVTKETYQRLRLDPTDPNLLSHTEATDNSREVTQTAFEWGETIFLMVYNFPYRVTDVDGDPVSPPVIQFQMNVEGTSFRTLSVEARQFRDPASSPVNGIYSPEVQDGFAVLSFTLQGGGVNALPPGNAQVQVSLSTAALNSDNQRETVVLDPSKAHKDFTVANPLALAMLFNGGVADLDRSIGLTVNPADPENAVNGSPDLTTTAKREDLLAAPLGIIPHNQSGKWTIGVVDRSLMTLLRGPGRGLDNVRAVRSDLAWQGGPDAVYKPIPQDLFPGFEDLPNDFNRSLDYPNILRERIKLTRSRFGLADNPIINPLSLDPPENVDENDPSTRSLIATLFDITLEVPRFQPPNETPAIDSAGGSLAAGYYGPLRFFVDANGDGLLTTTGGRREAYRQFNVAGAVDYDERFHVATPTVDLGSLSHGTGYATAKPQDQSPDDYLAEFGGLFKPFAVINDGNINLLNLRLAKEYQDGADVKPWELFSIGNHRLTWLDSFQNLHSDIDSFLAPYSQVLLQKPRVGDRAGSRLSPNPIRRENANLGVTSGPLLSDVSTGDPVVSVSIPLGFPVGPYLELVRVIEDDGDESLASDGESFAEPSFRLRFNVRETRLTNKPSTTAFPMIDDVAAFDGSERHRFANGQPAALRDANGNLVMLWTSSRSEFAPADPVADAEAASQNPQWRIYGASVEGGQPAPADRSPLGDLNKFNPSTATQWFSQDKGPFPAPADIPALFGESTPTVFVDDTARFGSPAFPSWGVYNPFSLPAQNAAFVYFAFVAEAQKQSDRGRSSESRIAIGRAQIGGTGEVDLSDAVSMPARGDTPGPAGATFDAGAPKGRPAIVQAGQHATVFYSVGSAGQTKIHWGHFDGTVWRDPGILSTGAGFESVSSPSAYARIYRGADGSLTGVPIIELLFAGKLEGSPNTDIYMARLEADSSARAVSGLFFAEQVDEVLAATAQRGIYRARGVVWDKESPIELKQVLNGVETSLILPSTKRSDGATGIVSYETPLGGRVYLDPARGTIRFAGSTPNQRARLLLTYVPGYIRVAEGGPANLGGPNLLLDERFIGDESYWAGAFTNAREDRYIAVYTKAASGPGQTARPYIRTMRFGVQLPTPIHTNSEGFVTTLTVTGATGPYQIDPANGKVYFQAEDEDRDVTITYVGLNPSNGGQIAPHSDTYTVGLTDERAEAPVAIDGAINESQVSAFLDPFDNASVSRRRPGLVWLFWTSTRDGSADLFFQTIAPHLAPKATTGG